MAHRPRHEGGFSQGQSVIGGGSSSTSSPPSQPSSPQDYFGSMFTSPGSSTQVTNQPPSVGFNEGQVDPGLMSGVMQARGMSPQQANQIAQQAMGNTGQGFGITGTGNFGTQDTSGSGTDTSGSDQGTDTSTSGSGNEDEDDDDNKQNIIDFFQQFSPLAQGGKLFGAGVELLFRTKPRAEQMSNPNALSIIRLTLLDENGQLDPKKVKEYYERHKDIIDKGTGVGSLEAAEKNKGLTNFDAFSNLMENAAEDGIQGTRSQFLADPEAYYDPDLFVSSGEQAKMLEDYPKFLSDMGLKPMSSRFGNTTTNLVDKANIDVNTPGLSDTFIQEIFNARMELDRMGKDRSGNPQGRTYFEQKGGGVTNIPLSAPVVPLGMKKDPVDPNATLNSVTSQGILNPIMSQGDPFNLTQFYASLPQYTQQGVMSPNLASYYDNLRRFYG